MPKDESVPTDEQAAAALSNLADLINNQGDEDEVEEIMKRAMREGAVGGSARERGKPD